MRVYSFFIAFQLSLLMWGGAYYSVKEIYRTLNTSQSSGIPASAQEVRGDSD